MLFDTPVYFVFLTLVVLLYWRLSWKHQNWMLLAASYFFYGWWDWRFLNLIAISTLVDYFCAHAIARSQDPGRRRMLLAVSVGINLAFLGFFKYFHFFTDSFSALLQSIGISTPATSALNVLLPPGISFYTFQAIAYIVDVYRRKIDPARSLVDYALFISLFPHLIAGPIQNPSHLLPQVQNPRRFDSERFYGGLMLILTGLFRKCVIADNCALLANAAFDGRLGRPSVVVFFAGVYAFAWQLYGDFSGYSDIARGSAQLMGFHFMVNFRQPYLATSLSDLWRRWHISLMHWLRDYVYIPLGGSRASPAKTNRNTMVMMAGTGLWHGASWNFAVWGLIHGIMLNVERWLVPRDPTRRLPATVRLWLLRILTFNCAYFWIVLFRTANFGEAIQFYRGLAFWEWRPEFGSAIFFLALFVLPMFAVDLLLESRNEEYPFEKASIPIRQITALAALCLLVAFSGNLATAFIYFRF